MCIVQVKFVNPSLPSVMALFNPQISLFWNFSTLWNHFSPALKVRDSIAQVHLLDNDSAEKVSCQGSQKMWTFLLFRHNKKLLLKSGLAQKKSLKRLLQNLNDEFHIWCNIINPHLDLRLTGCQAKNCLHPGKIHLFSLCVFFLLFMF